VRAFLLEGRKSNPFDSRQVEYVRDVRRSKQLNFMSGPMVIISASGMAETGRILHHLRNNIEGPDNTILFVGFQAENTLGRRLVEGARQVRILGDDCPVRAQVRSIQGYSAHADQHELLDWTSTLDRKQLQEVFVVHGEVQAARTLADKLRESGVKQAVVPERGQSFEF
jgi:metallo-beta-lactamase family protein